MEPLENNTVYDEVIDGWKVVLAKDGKLYAVKYRDWVKKNFPFREVIWYQKNGNGKGWIPRKRKSFVSLIKQILREDGEFEWKKEE